MKKYLNFSLYTPEMSDDEKTPAGALFLRSEDGVDWYAAQLEFDASTTKLMFDVSGVICCAEVDASGMWPVNCSVIEIEADELPPDFACNGQWVWDGRTVTLKARAQDDIVAKNDYKKSCLVRDAESTISALQRAVKYNLATEEEENLLKRWEIYTVNLNRVDTREPVWPDVP